MSGILGNKDKAIGNMLTHNINIRKQASHALSYDPFNDENVVIVKFSLYVAEVAQ